MNHEDINPFFRSRPSLNDYPPDLSNIDSCMVRHDEFS